MFIRRNRWCAAVILLGGCAMQQPVTTPAPATAVTVATAAAASPPLAPRDKPAPAAPETVASPPTHKLTRIVARPVAAPAPMAPAVPRATEPPMAKARTIKTAEKAAAVAFQIRGRVTLRAASGQSIASGEQADTLVYFVPAHGGQRPRPGHYTVYTNHRDFSPAAMAVPQGSTVSFVNLDSVRHNVFSVTPDAAFDLGYQASGEKVAHVFTRAGVMLIGCSVHRAMELDLLVVPGAHAAKVASDGSFSVSGLPAGAGTLYFWNPRGRPVSQAVQLPTTAVIHQQIVLTKPRVETQLNTGGER